LFAAPYALFQYNQSKEAASTEQILNMFKMYNSAPFTGYREKVTKALIKNRDKINAASRDVSALEAVQFEIIRQEDMEVELLLLFDFFDAVTFCVTAGVCDNNTAVKLFRPRALDIYLNFYQYMMAQRASTATGDFGMGLEAISKSGRPIAATN
jgi:hypothetical protein